VDTSQLVLSLHKDICILDRQTENNPTGDEKKEIDVLAADDFLPLFTYVLAQVCY